MSKVTTPAFRLTGKQREANRLLGDGQRHTLLRGGSRSGKTYLGVRTLVVRALKAPRTRHAIFRLHANSVWPSIGMDTLPAVVANEWPKLWPLIEAKKQDGYFLLPNGSEIWLGGLDDKARVDKILGREYATLYFNECSQIPYASVLVGLTRLAQKSALTQKALYDLNPTTTDHWSNQLFHEHRDPISRAPIPNPQDHASILMNPRDNEDNLDPAYLASLEALPEKQRKRFLDGEYVANIDGALWTLDALERCRVHEAPERLDRVVVAVDPSGASGKEDYRSDEIGIVVAGRSGRQGYALADRSMRGSPAQWARTAINAYHEFSADRIVAEVNYGGAMVEAVIKAEDPDVPVKVVTASRGKAVRADPIATLYDGEEPRVHHVGRFPEMEDQMCNFSTAGYMGSRSPDRADALVWAMTELMLGKKKLEHEFW
ncbi:MAG: phage terminase large subunit [Pseudomonadota bacterium]